MWNRTRKAMAASGEPSSLGEQFDSRLSWCARFECDGDEDRALQVMASKVIRVRTSMVEAFLASRGPRYSHCTSGNYIATDDCQVKAKEALAKYASEIDENVERGVGLILFGPKGTGKDHLAVALSRFAIYKKGFDVVWVNGMDLFGEFRSAMRKESRYSEDDLVEHYAKREILYISDPVPPTGSLSEWQTGILFRILDKRYSDMRPTWITINVSSAAELDERIGAPNGDRLRDGSLAIFFNWHSHRKVSE